MNFLKINEIATEAIDFQTSEFGDKITKLLDKILKSKNGKEADASPEAKELIKTVEDYTGLKLDLKFNTDYPPCMMPIHINPDTILGDSVYKSYYIKDANKIIKDLEENTKTFVDLKNAKVGGAFSVVPTKIWMGLGTLKNSGLSASECAAVLAHEIGHAFVAYELAFNTIQTNQILLANHKALLSGDRKLFEYSLKVTEKKIGATSGVYTELKDETDEKIVTTVVMAKMREVRKSELGTSAYDKNTYEALADNFATRMGFGRSLVTGLEKITRHYGGPEYSYGVRFSVLLVQLAGVGYFMSVGAMISGAVGAFVVGLPILLLFSWGTSDGSEYTNTYDKLQTRYKRIREQLINRLKSKTIDQAIVNEVLGDLKIVDEIVKNAVNYTTPLGVLGNIIFPSNWILSSRKNAQRLLEELSANDMFVKAAQLRGN